MSAIPIVCDNCGAKYKLPDSFTADRAKCKQCGSQIDVAAQRRAAASPPPARPAAPAAATAPAAPAHAERSAASSLRGERREEARAKTGESRRERHPRHRDRESPAGDAAAHEDRAGRRGHGGRAPRERPAGSKMPLVLSGIGILAIAVVAVILLQGGDGEAATNDSAKAPAAASPDAGKAAAGKAAADAAAPKPAQQAPAEAAAPKETQPPQPAPQAAPQAGGAAAPAPAATLEPGERWQRSKVTTMAEVFDPRTALQPVPWPDYVGEPERQKVQQWLDDVRNGGLAGIRAKTELEALGHKSVAGIINRLREVDYKDSSESMYAWELNKMLDTMTLGRNVGFVPVEPGDDMDPRKADWNAKTAKAWQDLLLKFPTAESWAEMLRERRAKQQK